MNTDGALFLILIDNTDRAVFLKFIEITYRALFLKNVRNTEYSLSSVTLVLLYINMIFIYKVYKYLITVIILY